jgi:hypothetical protein
LVDDFQVTQVKTKPPKNKKRHLGRRKVQGTIVKSLHLNIMATSYHIHFTTYSNGKKNMTQFIPSTVWKLIYTNYVGAYLDFPFVEDALKDHLQDAFKEFKISNSNEKEYYKTILQLNEALAQLKVINHHTIKIVLKRKQDFINGRHNNMGDFTNNIF